MSADLCAACDDPLQSRAAFACADCDSDLTPCCAACAVALHQPTRLRRHHLTRVDSLSLPLSDRVRGRGFCRRCCSRQSPAETRLAVLECEACHKETGAREAGVTGLCLECDEEVHASLDRDAHTRLYCDAPEDAAVQTGEYTLAGVDDIRLTHRDAMESYAGRIWPGSLMLARYCEQVEKEQPGLFKGKAVLELGCGCASIPSVTCLLLGARRLLCTDMNYDGLAMMEENINSVKAQMSERGLEYPHESDIDDVAASQQPSGADDVAASRIPLGLSTRPLAFGSPDASDLRGEFDIILGSYILYDPDSFELLADTLNAVAPNADDATSAPPPMPPSADEPESSASSSSLSLSLSPPPSRRSPLILLTSHEPTRESAFLAALESRGFQWQRVPFSLQTAKLSDEQHAEVAKSNIGTGLRSTSVLIVRRQTAQR